MIRKFCDICNCEIIETLPIQLTKRLVSGEIVDINITMPEINADGKHVCMHCTLDILYELDDR